MDSEQLATVEQVLNWAAEYFTEAGIFFGHGTDNAWDEAVVLVTHALGETPFADAEFANRQVSAEEKIVIKNLLEKRVGQRIPAPYLTGEAWFCGLPFSVNRQVLIPRSPIGELIHNQFFPWVKQQPKRILDLCTGSGCIGIACAYAFPEAEVVLSDISPEALAVAEQNIARHQLQDRVRAVQGDLYGGLADQQFDLIISNSPYVDIEDFTSMPPEYQHEPALALESGDDGLDFTRRLLAESRQYLVEGGVLIAEVGNSWVALEDQFPQLPFMWFEFEHGGHGVFLLEKNQLPSSDL